MADGLALGQDLGQVLRAEHVAQRRRRQEVRRVAEEEEEDLKKKEAKTVSSSRLGFPLRESRQAKGRWAFRPRPFPSTSYYLHSDLLTPQY